jgi:arylsulfatase A-like enzyme
LDVVAAIKEKGIGDNTIIFFCSDNGGPDPGRVTSNGPLRAGKGTLYEGGVRVPACKIEVFNIKDDPYEKSDLSQSNPEKRKTLWDRYQWYAEQAVPHLGVPDNNEFPPPKIWGNFD